MTSERDNLKAGLFVIVGILVAMIFIWQLADFDKWFAHHQTVKIFYRLSDGVRGLKPGAAVTLGDQPVGSVESIDPVEESGRVTGMIITVTLPQRVEMFQNAAVELVEPPLGSGTRLNIRSVGNDSKYDPAKPIEGQLAGSKLTASLVKDVGIEDAQRQQIQQIIENVRDLTAQLKHDVPEITQAAKQLLDKASPVLDNAREAVTRFKDATEDVRQITANVRQHSDDWLQRADNITANADATMGRVNKLLADKDPGLRQTLDNIRKITDEVHTQTMPRLEDALDKAAAALANARHATDQLDQFITSQRPVIERAVANAQITAGQLKLAAVEIRRSPWRLMYKPIEKELETDNLYDASRSLVLAAEAVQAATDSLRAVAEQPNVDPKAMKQMIDNLRSLLSGYDKAESGFWEAIRQYEPTSSATPAATQPAKD